MFLATRFSIGGHYDTPLISRGHLEPVVKKSHALEKSLDLECAATGIRPNRASI